MSGVLTASDSGIGPLFPGIWLSAFLKSWAIAFPTAIVVTPIVRRIVKALFEQPSDGTK